MIARYITKATTCLNITWKHQNNSPQSLKIANKNEFAYDFAGKRSLTYSSIGSTDNF